MTQPNVRVVLTPSFAPYKVVILSLIAAYCAGVLPKKTHRPLLATIVKYIEGPQSLVDTDNGGASANPPSLDGIIASIRQTCLQTDPEEGVNYADDIEKRLLHALWSLKSVDSLHAFVDRSKSLLVNNYRHGREIIEKLSSSSLPDYLLTRSSFLGQFVTQCVASFYSGEFGDIELVWNSFVTFRGASKSEWAKKYSKRIPDISDTFGSTENTDDFSVFAKALQSLPFENEETKEEYRLISKEDLEKLVNHQIHLLENYGAITSTELRQTLKLMTQSEASRVPSIYYIEYLECLNEANYEGAFNALHRYFDYMMSNRQTIFYHYALLCLATLHASFNCDSEAIRAIEESIDVARENNDSSCLHFLLSWLYNFMKDRPNLKHDFYVSADQLLQYLKANATDAPSFSYSTAYQSETTQIMLEGGSINSALESLTKSAYLSLTENDNATSFTSHCALASSLWFRTGNFDLAKVYSDIPVGLSASVSQKVFLNIRKAYFEFDNNNIDEAFKILDDQKPFAAVDIRLQKDLVGHKLLLLTEQCIRSSRYKMGELYLSRLLSQDHTDIDITGQTHYLEILLELKKGNAHKAYKKVSHHLSTFAKKPNNKYWFITFTLLNCQILCEGPVPTRALSIVIKCLQSSLRSGFTILLLRGVKILCQILQHLDQDQDVYNILLDCAPFFEQVPNHEIGLKSHQLLAKSLIALYDGNNLLKQQRIDQITLIISHIERSIDGFKKMSMFEEVKRSLELQVTLGKKINHEDLIKHAEKSLQTADERIIQEMAVQD
ncbi:Anaphase-promoting complex subunit 5 [Wickerhamomyces ciferrii]|uniref:Anaphase-promoting complex subunit 5 n=1 Tax=Wickerhamomyces ciferrii (strain ATCC 14091 / BCRC 22168 / CBS 111 / JCM 3599 / NBRC 0793 / NRRL Y-1031 F-60-10) TaxID=1206466 RepID=K0KGC2_WICCF|nr:Anaphase-promoting complex subunit 5 [Wickerhamomyces ciferrii]CCH40484.1 Anaphase-promoting complex subunit 5 [Wickerhamomyces ciferrii]